MSLLQRQVPVTVGVFVSFYSNDHFQRANTVQLYCIGE